jgi:hypothetical protein
VSGAGTHTGVPISFTNNVALEELSLVVAAEKSAFIYVSLLDAARFFERLFLSSPAFKQGSARTPNRPLKMKGGYNSEDSRCR